MRGVHVDDVFRQAQHALAELVVRHDSAQVAHGLAVLLRVCDGGQRVHSAVILRERRDVRPCLVVVVELWRRHAPLRRACVCESVAQAQQYDA